MVEEVKTTADDTETNYHVENMKVDERMRIAVGKYECDQTIACALCEEFAGGCDEADDCRSWVFCLAEAIKHERKVAQEAETHTREGND